MKLVTLSLVNIFRYPSAFSRQNFISNFKIKLISFGMPAENSIAIKLRYHFIKLLKRPKHKAMSMNVPAVSL
jgi:hypothetical protein